MLARLCQERGVEVPAYLNVEAAPVELIDRALAAGHMVCCTYSRSPSGRYGGAPIAHMLNVVHGANGHYGILDNNFPGVDKVEWLSAAEFRSVRPAWVVIFPTRPGPPPPPLN
jgi:hypothetical protein